MTSATLSERQAAFVREFPLHATGADAARAAGYSSATASVAAAKLKAMPMIADAIQVELAPLRDEAGERRLRIMARLEHDATMDDETMAAKVAAGVPIRGADRNKARELLLRVDGALRDNLAVTVTHQPTELEVETQRESLALLREMREALRVAVAARATAPALIEAPAIEAEFTEGASDDA